MAENALIVRDMRILMWTINEVFVPIIVPLVLCDVYARTTFLNNMWLMCPTINPLNNSSHFDAIEYSVCKTVDSWLLSWQNFSVAADTLFSKDDTNLMNLVIDSEKPGSLIPSFLIGRKRTVNFRNQCLGRHLASDSTIIMSRTLKVTVNSSIVVGVGEPVFKNCARTAQLLFCWEMFDVSMSRYHKMVIVIAQNAIFFRDMYLQCPFNQRAA